MNFTKTLFCSLLGLFLFGEKIQAQKIPHLSFYSDNWELFNPAAVDRTFFLREGRYARNLVLSRIRQQWAGIEGSPQFYSLAYRRREKKVNYGVSIFGERTHAISNYGIYGNYAYALPLSGSKDHLYIGVSGGLIQANQVNWDDIIFPDVKENIEEKAKDLYPSQLYQDFSFGLFYKKEQDFYAGFSIPSLLSINLKEKDTNEGIFASERLEQQHIYLLMGGFFSYGDFQNEPFLQIRYIPPYLYQGLIKKFPFSANINWRWFYRPLRLAKEQMWWGIGYDTAQFFHAEFGCKFQLDEMDLDVNLSYDIPMGGRLLQLGHNIELQMAMLF